MDHIPCDLVSTGFPVIGVNRLIVLDADKVETSGQIPVELVSGNYHFLILRETAGRIFHDGEYFGQGLLQYHFHLVRDGFLDFIYLGPDRLTFFQFLILDAFAKLFHLRFLLGYVVLDTLFDLICFRTQLVVRECLD